MRKTNTENTEIIAEENKDLVPCTEDFQQDAPEAERTPFDAETVNGLPTPRTLRADEIECRVGSITEKGLFLLLYKTARTDITLLDETYGPANWQRKQREENGHVVCSIWIRDPYDPTQWIVREDVGTESNTDPVKGAYSDSLKRAGVNWQIGLELYTSPKIWIPAVVQYDGKTTEMYKAFTNNKTGKPMTYDTFVVTRIGYDESRRINDLQIANFDKRLIVYDKKPQ